MCWERAQANAHFLFDYVTCIRWTLRMNDVSEDRIGCYICSAQHVFLYILIGTFGCARRPCALCGCVDVCCSGTATVVVCLYVCAKRFVYVYAIPYDVRQRLHISIGFQLVQSMERKHIWCQRRLRLGRIAYNMTSLSSLFAHTQYTRTRATRAMHTACSRVPSATHTHLHIGLAQYIHPFKSTETANANTSVRWIDVEETYVAPAPARNE